MVWWGVRARVLSVLLAASSLAALGGLAAVGFQRGWYRLNHPDQARYPVWGIDVSRHQGRIDWAAVVAAEPRLRFAYIKATEGGDWKDPRFDENWRAARAAGLRVGPYHFFTFCRSGDDQARHFLSVLPRDADTLPPAVDLEFGGNCRQPPDREVVQRELASWLQEVERAVGRRPVVYVTEDAYRTFLEGSAHPPLWVRNVVTEPGLPPGEGWLFWQFHHRGRVAGIPAFVDLDVFHADREALDRL